MIRRILNKIPAIVAAGTVLLTVSAAFCACGGAKSEGAARLVRFYNSVLPAENYEYRESVTAILNTPRGSYRLSRTVTADKGTNGTVFEIYASQADRSVEFTSFSDGEYSYCPVYGDIYVKKPLEKPAGKNVPVLFPCADFVSAQRVTDGIRRVIALRCDCENVRLWAESKLADCGELDAITGGEKGVFSELTLYVGLEGELPYYRLTGTVAYPSAALSAEFDIELEYLSLDGVGEVVFPLTEEQMSEAGGYSDFVKTFYQLVPLVSQSQWTVLFGFDPGEDFDFMSFDFADYNGVLFWDDFIEAVK